jgi:hypothetical protein
MPLVKNTRRCCGTIFLAKSTFNHKWSIMDTRNVLLSNSTQVGTAQGTGDLLFLFPDARPVPLDLDDFDQVSGGIAPAVVAGIAAATAVTFAAGAVFGAAVAVVVMSGDDGGDSGGDKGPVIAPGT